MSDELTNDQISQWLEVAAPCLFAAWQYGQTPDDADPVAWFAEVYGQGAPGPVHAVHVIGDDGRTVAVTGNGPRSAAHAKFLAWSNPGNVSKLLRDFRAMRERALAAERLLADERAAHAETSRDLDALLTALGAQVTPGGQTLESCHARRVADGMRRAKRATESAPAKCSCTREAGDSWCLAHPTCAECGAFTPSCVDACADHVKPAPATRGPIGGGQ